MFPNESLEAIINLWQASPLHKTYFLLIAFFWGSCWGSFVQASSHRIPRGISLIYPGSRCPQCQHKLGLMDNFPLLGWLFLKGRCRYCRVPIPFRYLGIEFITGFLHIPFFILAMESDQPLSYFILASLFISWAMLLTLIDGEHRFLPDLLTLGPLLGLICIQGEWSGQPFHQPLMDFFFLAILLLLPQSSIDLLRSLAMILGGERIGKGCDKLFSPILTHGDSIRPLIVLISALPILLMSIWIYPNINEPIQKMHWHGLGVALAILWSAERLTRLASKSPGLGLGDIKLGALLGWVLGWPAFLITLGLACSTTLSIGILKGVHRRQDTSLPFGPALIWSSLAVYLVQANFIKLP
jgi:prepilin signal peptidase PulO-like enzyme (type II secretory pathway)